MQIPEWVFLFCEELHILPLNIHWRWLCMGLSRKVLLLWSVRVFVLLVLALPLMELTGAGRPWCLVIFIFLALSAFVFFMLRYKSCTIEITPEHLTLHTGIIIRRKLSIRFRHIVGINRICTPLSSRLQLSNPVIFCEGAVFLLPPLEKAVTEQIENNIKSEVEEYEP